MKKVARRIIDAHNHPNWHGMDIDALVANMDDHGIEKTWLLSWEISKEEFDAQPIYHGVMDPRGLSAPLWMVVEGLHKYPDRFIGGWAPDPRERHVRAKLKAAVDIHGIKVYGELKCRMRYDNPDAIATFRYCAELSLPVLFHLEAPAFSMKKMYSDPNQWAEWYGGDMSVVDNMCRLCPKTKFIGHGPGFWMEISPDADRRTDLYPRGRVAPGGRLTKLMRKYRNLYCDLSAGSGCNALTRDMKHAKIFITEFQNRIIFGRDNFNSNLLDTLEKLKLDKKIMNGILYRNAEKLLKPPKNT